ncbi:hypothetical protein B0A48_17748 [Cryoendolithus antarcticus]|uniref:Probable endonuclease LCL3 n=1 Tax=Cryoendolithus antarcticus TaxID=1507870 RepID=A0A1V8SAK9_9PEZI|nr:hypothetical protein B0A48_17748 [Cryoendolithus antarcticus]
MALPSPQFQARVKSVLSGDTLILLAPTGKSTRTLSLAAISAPRMSNATTSAEPHAFASREYLRKLVVGKTVRFSVLYAVPGKAGNREYGVVMLADGSVLPDAIVAEGMAKLRDGAEKRSEAGVQELVERLEGVEARAKSQGKGVWETGGEEEASCERDLGADPKAFVEEWKGKAVESVVERVISGDRVVVRMFLEKSRHVQVTVLLAGIRAPGTARTNQSDGATVVGEPLGEESQAFVEERLLQRGVTVRVLGLSPQGVLVGEVRHPVGNIAEFLLQQGLARCVDHHSTMLGAEMGKLRQAERTAKEKKLGLYQAHEEKRSTGAESEAVVSRVFSADTLFIRNKNGVEKRVNLSSVRQPKPTDPKQSPFGPEAKEFLRKKLIGKHVKVNIDGKRPGTEGYEEREMATVSQNGKNVALTLVESGYASVIRHRMDDTDRSAIYDELLAAEETAQSEGKGMWSPKPPKQQVYVDYSESLEKAKRQMTLLSRQKRVPAIVDFVKSGSRFTVLIPRENAKLTFVLGGIRAPRSARGPNDTAEPFGQECHDFANKRCQQRDVEIDVEDNDKVGGFIGTMYINRESVAKLLVEEGLASVHAYSAEKSGNANELFAAETKAREGRKGMWHDWSAEKEAAENGADHEPDATSGANGNGTSNGDAALPARKPDYKDITVTHIDASTGRLKIQLLGSGTSNLSTLMKDFASFHLSPQNSLPLSGAPKAGDVVSAKFSADGTWYRAKIRRNDREAKAAEVVYIDYGNSETQPWSALRQLPAEKFGAQKLKPQAVDAALSFLQFPAPTTSYLADSVAFLQDVALDRPLVANVDFNDTRDNLLWVTLLDPGAKSLESSLNAEVVSEGLAMVAKKLRPFERAAGKIVTDLQEREREAKDARRGQWEYGDLTED